MFVPKCNVIKLLFATFINENNFFFSKCFVLRFSVRNRLHLLISGRKSENKAFRGNSEFLKSYLYIPSSWVVKTILSGINIGMKLFLYSSDIKCIRFLRENPRTKHFEEKKKLFSFINVADFYYVHKMYRTKIEGGNKT